MTNLALKFSDDGEPDIEFANGLITLDPGLRTAVLLSIFTDARVASDELPEGETSRRGWWASPEDESIGSRLWLYSRAYLSVMSIEEIRQAAEDSLAWLIEVGILETVEVTATRPSRNVVAICVQMFRGSATRFQPQWDATLVDEEIIGSDVRVSILKS